MRFISRRALGAFVAVCVMSVVAAASASAALPEFVPNGSASKPITFRVKLGHVVFRPVAWGQEYVECESASATGSIVGAKELTTKALRLVGCGLAGESTHACTSGSLKSGEVETEALSGTLGYVEKEPSKVVGLKLEGPHEGIKRPEFAAGFTCVVAPLDTTWVEDVTGPLYGQVQSLNKPATAFVVAFKTKKSSSEQELTKFEGETNKIGDPTGQLEASAFHGGGLFGVEGESTFEKFETGKEAKTEIEIKA